MSYIALLRGINVSGQKKIPMVELRSILSLAGLNDVRTYIQTGNVLFNATGKSIVRLESHIQETIKNHFGFEVDIIVKTPKQLKKIIDDCPFDEPKKLKSYFTILHDIPENGLIEEASKKQYPNEEYYIINDCIYAHFALGAGKAKFDMKFFERKFNTIATTRNYNTMMKLVSLSAENS